MKATELLQRQHREVEALLERLHAAGQGDETRIRHELAAALVAHAVIEQDLFYPAVREVLPLEVLEAIEEHGLFDVQLARLLAEKPGGDAFEAKAAVLAEIVVRHIRREESEILKTAERELGDEHLNRLGEQMALRHRNILDAGFHKHLQKALAEELPRTPSRARRAAAKKTTRRAPAAAKKAKAARAAGQRRAPSTARTTRRAAATKRATPKHRARPAARKATQAASKPARARKAPRASASSRARP